DTVFIIDGSGYIFRAYYAIQNLSTSSGVPTNAVYGFVNMLLKVLQDEKPERLAICFDTPKPSFRKDIYKLYKANRDKAPEDLGPQIALIHRAVDCFGITRLQMEGFEADDVIGTFVDQAKADGYRVEIITGDKDLMQLVNPKVRLYMPVKGMSETAVFDVEGVVEKLGIKPEQVVDYKALVGDQSDNYPGVHGVGPKTAVGLLEEFGSFEEIYKAVDAGDARIKPAVLKKLVAGREGGELSKDLARIRRNVEVDLDWKQARAVVSNPGKLSRVLEEYGFASLVRQLGLEEGEVEGQLGLF
ncbi:MAG: DNA polymerase I, partial [Bdellovibrionales bacterium]|nr:DNA polymerase I [Bdellovibrionales bacterium]